jgi:Helix-turn-helix domain
VQGDQRCPGSAHSGLPENPMNVMTGNRMGEDLMTRRQVASLFRVTSAAVASWARRGRLPEVRDEAGRPRYRRSDVEALFRSDVRQRPQ